MPLTLEEQLKIEIRICPQCKNEITNPFVTRCPRCLADVPTEKLGCNSCIHRSSCPAIADK